MFVAAPRLRAFESTRTGLVNPNSLMLAAICAICASEWVRGLRAYGTNLSTDHCSMCLALTGSSLWAFIMPPITCPTRYHRQTATSCQGIFGGDQGELQRRFDEDRALVQFVFPSAILEQP